MLHSQEHWQEIYSENCLECNPVAGRGNWSVTDNWLPWSSVCC